METGNANTRQIGGSHYRKGGSNQHWDFVEDNGLGYLEGCATKYVTRWRFKNGLQDLEKALHYLDKLIEKTGQRHRLPRGHAHAEDIAEFAEANELNDTEFRFVALLSTWTCNAELDRARILVKQMLEAPEEHGFV